MGTDEEAPGMGWGRGGMRMAREGDVMGWGCSGMGMPWEGTTDPKATTPPGFSRLDACWSERQGLNAQGEEMPRG